MIHLSMINLTTKIYIIQKQLFYNKLYECNVFDTNKQDKYIYNIHVVWHNYVQHSANHGLCGQFRTLVIV